ncbi:MAG TPA: zinc ABC transporter substrate-binding protein [Geomonas sp.]|nr:zinc ABC transporter substrate-binding protein [Geomonas sp.]
MQKMVLILVVVAVLAVTAACSKNEQTATAPGPHKLTVVTTLFPLYDFAKAVAGDKANVSLLLPPGVEPHSFEPKPDDVVKMSKADVVIYTNEYLEPWAVKLLQSVATKPVAVDTSKGVRMMKVAQGQEDEHGEAAKGHDGHIHHGGLDPHIWLDFNNAQVMVQNIAVGLIEKDPANKEYYLARAKEYQQKLQKLDDEYKRGLANCRKRIFLHGGHYAFGYLAKRYDLTYLSAQAVDPDAEATPQKLAELVKAMRENGLKYVYCEELLSPATAQMIARETGAEVLMLNAAHNISKQDFDKGTSFISLMEQNLANLRKGLQCS